MRSLLPAGVAVVDIFGDFEEARLLPAEAVSVERAVEKRRREYATVRHCARLAFGELGAVPTAIPTGKHREPIWPLGLVGALTHCDGYRAAAVARGNEFASIGIDAEPHEPLPAETLGLITRPEERDHLDQLAIAHPKVHWGHALFSAKESVYKAWFPLARRWLGFEDAAVWFDPGTRTFMARLLVPPPSVDGVLISVMVGRWKVDNGLIRTAVTVPRR